MTSLALPGPHFFSLVTTAGPGARILAWKSLFGADGPGMHIGYTAKTHSQRNLWAARLDQAVLASDKPVLLIASGESCVATAWWARLSPANYVSRVAGALLFAPRGTHDGDARFASPAMPLPFPSAIVERKATRRARGLAQSWGSGAVEGWTAEDGSAWHHAQTALMRFTERVVERDLRVARALDIVV